MSVSDRCQLPDQPAEHEMFFYFTENHEKKKRKTKLTACQFKIMSYEFFHKQYWNCIVLNSELKSTSGAKSKTK